MSTGYSKKLFIQFESNQDPSINRLLLQYLDPKEKSVIYILFFIFLII